MVEPVDRAFRTMGVTGEIAAVLMIVFGIAVILMPALIAWIVGLYLILHGLLSLVAHFGLARTPPSTNRPL